MKVIRSLFSLRTFIILSLLLFMVVSYQNTFLIAQEFHVNHWPWVVWAFTAALEAGIIMLTVARATRSKVGLSTRWFSLALICMLLMSTVANFLSGVQSFYPAFDVLTRIRAATLFGVPVWWVLPLMFAAAVPFLVFMSSEQLATLEVERREAESAPPMLQLPPSVDERVVQIVTVAQRLASGTIISSSQIQQELQQPASTVRRWISKTVEAGYFAPVDGAKGQYMLLSAPKIEQEH